MTIHIGGNRINDIRIGNTAINKVYIGANKVWERNYSATLTVGSTYIPPQFGESAYTFYGKTGSGSLNNTDAGSFSEDGAVVSSLHWKPYLANSGTAAKLTFKIYKSSGFSSGGNSGWTTLSIGSHNFSRSSMSFAETSTYKTWTKNTTTNPFGTTVGATRAVTVT